jgi:hypothetical protein
MPLNYNTIQRMSVVPQLSPQSLAEPPAVDYDGNTVPSYQQMQESGFDPATMSADRIRRLRDEVYGRDLVRGMSEFGNLSTLPTPTMMQMYGDRFLPVRDPPPPPLSRRQREQNIQEGMHPDDQGWDGELRGTNNLFY